MEEPNLNEGSQSSTSNKNTSKLGRPTVSIIWEFFEIDSNNSKCKECGKVLAGKKSSNLENHLKAKHTSANKRYLQRKEDLATELKEENSSVEPKLLQNDSLTQQSIPDAFRLPGIWTRQNPQQQKFQRLVSILIGSHSILPESLVDNNDFWRLMHFLNPRVRKFSRSVVRSCIDKVREQTDAEIRLHLESATHINLQADIWTKRGMAEAFLGCCASFFCYHCNQVHNVLLGIQNFDSPHTGDRCFECIEEILRSWSITTKKVVRCVTDNGSNMVAAFKHSEKTWFTTNTEEIESVEEQSPLDNDNLETATVKYLIDGLEEELIEEDDPIEEETISPDSDVEEFEKQEDDYNSAAKKRNINRTPCISHTLELVAKECEKNEQFNDLYQEVRKIISAINHSYAAKSQFLKICSKSLPSFSVTRWANAQKQLSAMVELRDGVEQVCKTMKIDCLSNRRFSDVDGVAKLLEPLAQKTIGTLQSDMISISQVIHAVLELDTHFEEMQMVDNVLVADLANALKEKLNSRFQFLFSVTDSKFDPIFAQSLLLDPRYKAYYALLSTEVKDLVQKEIKRQLKNENKQDEITCENASNVATVSSDPLLAKLLKRQRMDVSSQAVPCGVSD